MATLTTHRSREQMLLARDQEFERLDAAAVKARMDRTDRRHRMLALAERPVKRRQPRCRLQSEGIAGVSRWTATTASRKAA